MYNYIWKDVVISAIKWLKENNKLYGGVELNDSWADEWLYSEFSSFLSETDYDIVHACDDDSQIVNEVSCDNVASGNVTVQSQENRELVEDQKATDANTQLTGRPTSNILQFENIEQEVYTCAPGENNVPCYMLMDDEFEVLAFPDMFPYGVGGYSTSGHRKTKLSMRKYFLK